MFLALLLCTTVLSADSSTVVQVRLVAVDGKETAKVDPWIEKELLAKKAKKIGGMTEWITLSEEEKRVYVANGIYIDGKATCSRGTFDIELNGCAGGEISEKASHMRGDQKLYELEDLIGVYLAVRTISFVAAEPKGEWTHIDGKPESVRFDYGTTLTAKEIDHLSTQMSLTEIVMGYAGVDSEFVEIEGDLLKLGRLKNLEKVHLNKDEIVNDDLAFIASLPKIQTLEFNADNGYEGGPVCTDECANHLRSAKTLRRLVIHDGKFTDKFVAKLTEGLPNLEALSLNSAELTNESLRLIAERCKKLKSLSIASNHFTTEGLKHLDKLMDLEQRAVSSPALRESGNPNEISKLLGAWEYVSATYDGKPIAVEENEIITLSEGGWTHRRNGKLISRSSWEVDSTRNPKWLTEVIKGGKINFVNRWVYKFDEEQLVICKSSWADGRRPTEFASQKGDKQYKIVLRRKTLQEDANETRARATR